MEQRLSILTLGVSDLKKSKGFYDALGWSSVSHPQDEAIIAYDLQGMTFALYPREEFIKEINTPLEKPKYSSFSLAYNVSSESEVDQVIQEAITAGGEMVKPPEKVFWGGYSGYFADPDGNLWEVAFNPFSRLGPNGEFQWNGYPDQQ